MWWDWVKTSRDIEVMTWAEFHELFTGKYFLVTARHAKAREFLELKQGTMTVMEYMAKFTELAHFVDDYVAMDMAKVRRFEDGQKLSIWGKIVGFLLQDMDSMVRIAMAIEREIEDTRSIRDAGAGGKWKESKSSSSSRKKQKDPSSRGFQSYDDQGQGQARTPSQVGQTICYFGHQLGHMRRDCSQRPESQGFGTVQSQSFMGQVWTQFIHPSPNTSKRNQYHSQGAAQAPSATLTCQRG